MADDQTGDQNAAAGQGQETQNQDTPLEGIPDDLKDVAQKGPDGKGYVPIDALTDERGKRQTLEAEVKALKDQVFLYQMNTPRQQQQQPQQQAQEPTDIPDLLRNMADDDVISAGELKQMLKSLKLNGPAQSGIQYDDRQWETIGEQMLSSLVDDVQEVFRGELTSKLQDPASGPMLMNTIRNSPAILRPFVAYRLAKGQSASAAKAGAKKDAAKAEKQEGSQKIVKNAQKPAATSSIAGQGAFDQASRFASMSDEDFQKEINRVKQSSPAGAR